MDEQKFSFSDSFQKAKEYVDTQIELLKLEVIARASTIGAKVIVGSTKLMLVLSIIFFCAMSLGFWLGELLESNALGFLATGGIFLIILLIVSASGRQLEKKFMGLIVERIFAKRNEEVEAKANAEKSSPKHHSVEKEFNTK